jgi:hypothetical protein
LIPDTIARAPWWRRLWRNDFGSLNPAHLRARRNGAWFFAVLSLVFTAVIGWFVLQGPQYDFPAFSKLHAVSGPYAGSSFIYRSGLDITLWHGSDGVAYFYPYKAGRAAEVNAAFAQGGTVTLWIDPGDGARVHGVFQVAVNGHIVRSYDAVKADWTGNNRFGRWLLGFFVFSTVSLAWQGWRYHRDLPRSIFD